MKYEDMLARCRQLAQETAAQMRTIKVGTDRFDDLFARCLKHGQETADIEEAMRWFSHASKLSHLFWNGQWAAFK